MLTRQPPAGVCVSAFALMHARPETIPGFPEHRVHMGLAIDFMFICSFLGLGEDFWDKLRALFIYSAKAA